MNNRKNEHIEVVVAGFGSPHGDDQLGWRVSDLLAGRPQLLARTFKISEGTQLVGELEGCLRLIVVDACCSNRPIGTISRFRWPDVRIRQRHSHSTHGIGMCAALELAERLGRLPPHVEVFGVEIREPRVLSEMSADALRAASELETILYTELCEAPTCTNAR